MMRSLYSGVAGLKTHQTKMDVIGNNIANVNTTSFKSQSITFSDLMYQTTQNASGATETRGGINARQIGLGAKSGAINTAIESQGATQTTNNPFDIMITGKSFFVVTNGKDKLYTRDGSFYIDGAGNLAMQSNGYFVLGWNAIEDPETGAITVNKNGELSNLQIMSADNTTYSPASTTAALYSGNIDDNDTNVVSDDGKTVTLEFYDNKGYLYTAKFNIKDTEDPNDHLFSLQLTDIIDSEGQSIGTERLAGVTFGEIQPTESIPVHTDSDYEIEPVTGKDEYVVYIKAGTPLFNGAEIPKDTSSLSLQDLMSSKYSKQKYAGLLNQVYHITDDDILNGTINGTKVNGLTKSSKFTIDPDTGNLNVILKIEEKASFRDVDDPADGNLDFGYQKNSRNYYVDTNSKGYRAIDATENGELVAASKLTTSTLENVFGVSAANAAEYTNKEKDYVYSFTVNETTGVGTLKIFNKVNLKEATTQTTIEADALDDYYDSFDGLSTAITNLGANPTDLKYTFKNGDLKVYHKEEVSPTRYTGDVELRDGGFVPKVNDLTLNDLSTLAEIQAGTTNSATILGTTIHLKKYYDTTGITGTGFDTLLTAKIAEVTQKITDDGIDPTDTTNEYVQKLASLNNLKDIVDALPADAAAFSFGKNITGTDEDGYRIYDCEKVKDYVEKYSGSMKALVNEEDTKVKTYTKTTKAGDDYPYVFYNLKDDSVFVLTEKQVKGTSIEDYHEDMLSEVFGLTKADYDQTDSEGNQIEFLATPSQSGLVITHEEPYTIKIDSENFYTEEGDKGGTVFKSLKRRPAYGEDKEGNPYTVPGSGDIKDILNTASTVYSGALEDLYKISDSNARAYGDDGKYTIDGSGNITLTNGSQSIQLIFDAATGKIISANGNGTLNNSEQKVMMKFCNEKGEFVEGNEAFGFQVKNENDEDEVARRGTIEIDFSTVTNYNTNGSSTIKVVKGDKQSLNTGRAVGEMNGVTVSTDGTIYATYSNGQTKLLGQIASAQFANASGLSKEGDNLYKATLNSGEATIQDITTDGGYMNTGVLEMSNVDLSSQFTEMITTQRGFQANSRIITVSDTLLEELTNLKR
jgi:flagellar hook protein FlgE